MMKKILKAIFGTRDREAKPKDFEWESFQKSAKDQFVKLREKGLSISVVTL
jgi:hypothetical protein